MNQSGVTGVPGATGPSRTQWLVITAVVVCLALVAGGLLYLLPVLELLGNHDAAPGRGVPAPAHAPPPLDSKQRINILLLGSDNDQKFPQDALLSQTMIVVSVDPAHHQVTLLSLPRDLWVEIPGLMRPDEIIIVGRPSRVPGEYRLLMVTLKRPLDGFTWGTRQGEAVD